MSQGDQMRLHRWAVLLGALASLAAFAPSAAQDAAPAASTDAIQDLVGGTPDVAAPPTVASPADPAPAQSPAPAAKPSKASKSAVRAPSPAMTPGTSLKFSLVSTEERHGGSRDGTRTNRQAIELQIMPRSDKARVVRYLIRSGEIQNDPLAQAMLNASQDLATDFEAGPDGKPLRLVDWPGVRAAMLKKLITDPSAPVEGAQRVKQLLDSMDPVSAIPFAIPEPLMMSDMQGWPPLSAGRHEEPAAVIGAGAAQGRVISAREVGDVDPGACTVRLTRSTTLDPASPAAQGGKEADTLETTADVSTVDGWVVRLTQTRTHKSGATSEARTWTMTRDDPPPCKG